MSTIKEGDKVDIFYCDGNRQNGVTVVHTPGDIGDLWYFEYDNMDGKKGTFALNPMASNFESMHKIS